MCESANSELEPLVTSTRLGLDHLSADANVPSQPLRQSRPLFAGGQTRHQHAPLELFRISVVRHDGRKEFVQDGIGLDTLLSIIPLGHGADVISHLLAKIPGQPEQKGPKLTDLLDLVLRILEQLWEQK